MTSFLVEIAATAAGALIAAYLGITLAVRKLRVQRSFEKRLDWHESVARELFELSQVFSATARALKANDLQHFCAIQQDAITRIIAYQVRSFQARLYASPETVQLLERVNSDLVLIGDTIGVLGTRRVNERAGHLFAPTGATVFRFSTKLMEHAASVLGRDVRTMLKAEPLPNSYGIYSVPTPEIDAQRQQLRDLIQEFQAIEGTSRAANANLADD